MSSKIRIKLGQIEVEYEGPEDFLKKELPELLAAVSKLYQETGRECTDDHSDPSGTPRPAATGHKKTILGTTATIASKLQCKSGGDVCLAAAAQLTFGEGKPQFSRLELLTSAQAATGYYKDSYSGNFTKIIQAHIKAGRLLEAKKNVFTLSPEMAKELEAKLAV